MTKKKKSTREGGGIPDATVADRLSRFSRMRCYSDNVPVITYGPPPAGMQLSDGMGGAATLARGGPFGHHDPENLRLPPVAMSVAVWSITEYIITEYILLNH